MALAGELAKYIGGELVKNTGKELATKTATSALSNLAPKIATKAVADMANKSVLNSLVPTATRKLASGVELGTDMIPMFRGQMNTLDKLDYNKGLSPNSNGFFMTPNKSATDSWAGKGVVSVDADPNDIMTLDELRSLKKSAEKYFRDPKYQMELYNTNPTQAEIYDALEASDSYQELSRLTKKPFIERDGGQGTELGEVVFFPDTNPELTNRYNADLASGKNQWLAPTEDVVASETAVPAGTKISFNKDLSIKSIDEPSKGRGWFADNSNNPHIAQAIKQSGADKYLGEPKVSQSLMELSPIVADENGVAKTFYHGSPSMDITDFDINMASKNTRSGERAIWFTDDYPTAEEFSYERIPGDTLFADKRGAKGKVYERNLGLENPLDLSNLSDKQIEELYKYADSRMAFDGKENFIRRMKEFRDAGNDQLIKSQLDMKKLSNSEYDGIVAKMYPGENEVREIGVFDPRKIKNVDNLNPTGNPDIRYATGLGKGSSGFDESIERIGSDGLPATKKDTLPAGWDTLEKYLGGVDKRVENVIGKAKSKITKADLVQFLEENDYDSEGTFNELWQRVKDAVDDMTMEELNFAGGGSAADIIQMRQRPDMNNIEDVYMGDKGHTGRLDAEYSDRLGISKSTTPMSDKLSQPLEYAQGDYGAGVIGLDTTWSSGEAGVSNVAHERMHAWQDKSRGFDYSDEFKKAFEELEDEIIPLLHNKEEISKFWNNRNTDYYLDRNEQEARMVQDYLEYKNHTKRYMGGNRKYEYDERIIKPFDKFYAKLRELSKKGIAIPALAGVFGLGALANKNDDEKLDNIK